ncbi:hypothetical protein GCM10011613_35970 [Cellvibrio zantedeschiae]|uniref:Uncharacterized protein n=2 Tax=Cellvibrio zantedeschiae TaxID=1237077 RepID=A0ABQ3BEX5_9GAMM|nr:hypothetical protein GCM10011613_35970 [Cellvibrio zantedeschiae]
MKCGICGRILENSEDPLSSDCGGDCWGCIGETEADSGYIPSLEQVRLEYAAGLRPNLIFSPKISFNYTPSPSGCVVVEAQIKLSKPNGAPWAGEVISVCLVCSTVKENFRQVSQEEKLTTNSAGNINFVFTFPEVKNYEKLYVEVFLEKTKWRYPVVLPNS